MGSLMDKALKIFSRTTGLNNKQDASELEANFETGLTELSEAVNIDITDRGKIKRRAGFERLDTDAWYSIAGFGDFGLGLVGDSLFIIHPDGTFTGIRSGLTSGAKMSYQQVIDEIFYCNGSENGVVRGNASWTWLSNTAPTTPGVKYNMRHLTAPPIGELVSYLSSRIYIAKKDVLFFSLPWSYYWFVPGQDFITFSGKTNMLCPTVAGMFVGTEKGVFFMRGLDPHEAEIVQIADYPAVKWSNVKVDPKVFPPDFNFRGDSWAWVSKEGICVGSGDGIFFNLTNERLDIEFALEGAGLFDGSKYIGLLNP
jgi:hypothetical protein